MKAFPSSTQNKVWEDGMELRDYFAIHAKDNDIFKYQVDSSGLKEIRTRAEARYMFADEMMEARKK